MDFKLFYDMSVAITLLQVLANFIASPPVPLNKLSTFSHLILLATYSDIA